MKIFISYRRKMGQFDNSNSGYIKLFLEKHGYEVFVDVHNNRPGNFIDRIFQEIQMSQVFLLLLTPNALDNCVNANDFVRLEIETAIQYQVTIIPILYEGFAFPKDMPQSISNVALWHGINYHQNSEVGFEHELLSFLENMEGTKKYSTASAAPLVYSDPAAGRVYFSNLQQPEYGTAEPTVTFGEEQREEFHRNMNRDEEAAAEEMRHAGFFSAGDL